MINKFIIPFLIIIFSLLIIYYILDKRNKEYFIEKFIPIIKNNILNNEIYGPKNDKLDDMMNSALDDTRNYARSDARNDARSDARSDARNDSEDISEHFKVTPLLKKKLENSPNNELPYIIYSLKGEWTNNKSIVDGNMIYNTTIIDISNENKATVTFKFQNNKDNIYNIIEIKDNSIICESSDKRYILYVRLLNDKNDSKVYKNTLVQYNGQKCLYSFHYIKSSKPFLTYISYQILQQPVDANLLNIIRAKDWNISFIKEPYDFKTYSIIVGKYKFPKKIMKIKNSTKKIDDKKNFKLIKEKYPDGITFYIKRVYKSPNGKNKEIKTHISKPFKLVIKNEDDIPEMIKIISFEADKKLNSSKKYVFNKAKDFVPICTYIYVAQLYHMTDQLNKKIPKKKVNKNKFNLHKNAKNIFKNNIEFININKLVKNITYNYKMKYVNSISYSKKNEKNRRDPYIYNISFNEILKNL